VADDPGRVVLKLSNHPRLVAAVGGAIGHVAARAGWDARAMADLIAAAEEACRNAFSRLAAADAQLGVTIEGFPDRVVVTIEHKGPPAPGAAEPGSLSGGNLLTQVDRVQYDTEGDVSRMILIKYSHAQPKSEGRG
jgi:anti-sigma regulatory factor (Ser/Thr protein kinase)